MVHRQGVAVSVVHVARDQPNASGATAGGLSKADWTHSARCCRHPVRPGDPEWRPAPGALRAARRACARRPSSSTRVAAAGRLGGIAATRRILLALSCFTALAITTALVVARVTEPHIPGLLVTAAVIATLAGGSGSFRRRVLAAGRVPPAPRRLPAGAPADRRAGRGRGPSRAGGLLRARAHLGFRRLRARGVPPARELSRRAPPRLGRPLRRARGRRIRRTQPAAAAGRARRASRAWRGSGSPPTRRPARRSWRWHSSSSPGACSRSRVLCLGSTHDWRALWREAPPPSLAALLALSVLGATTVDAGQAACRTGAHGSWPTRKRRSWSSTGCRTTRSLLAPAGDAIVMKVHSPVASYWRANVLSEFIGSAWISASDEVPLHRRGNDGSWMYDVRAAHGTQGRTVTERFDVQSDVHGPSLRRGGHHCR